MIYMRQQNTLLGMKVYLNMLKERKYLFFTPFDYKGVDLLDNLNTPF